MTMLKEASSFASDVTFSKHFQQQKSHLGKQQSTSFSDKSSDSAVVTKQEEVDEEKKKPSHNKLKKFVSFFKSLCIKYWFLLGLAVAIILAWRFPDVGRREGYIRAEWSVKWGKV
jgi:sodium/bile acid cotransporter 7